MINILLSFLYKLYNKKSNIDININDSIFGFYFPIRFDIYASFEKKPTLTLLSVNVKYDSNN